MEKSVVPEIVGTWKLVSWTYIDKSGATVNFFGEHPNGILMYDAHGYMNAQLMKLPRRNFDAQKLFGGTSDEMEGAYKTYAAYYGTYHERSPGELIHVVEGSLFPNWVGQEEIRYAKIVGDELTLSAPPTISEGHQITFNVRWQRVGK